MSEMTIPTAGTDVGSAAADYVLLCQEHLRDLPPEVAAQLRQDIEEIVYEVCAELGGAPRELVGPPQRFVAELRATAGHPTPETTNEARPVGPASPTLRARLRRAWQHPAARWVRELLPELGPAWWAARGFLVAVALGRLTGGGNGPDWLLGVVPFWPVLGSRPLGVACVAAAVYVSVEAGRRSLPWRRRVLRLGASVVAVVTGLIAASDARSATAARQFSPPPYMAEVPPRASAHYGSGQFDLVWIGSDVTGLQEPVVDLPTATALLDSMLVDSPPAALFVERAGARVYPGTREEFELALQELAAQGLLNPAGHIDQGRRP